jgi:hypothetical protein
MILLLFNSVGYMYVLEWCRGELQRKAEELIDTHASEISGNLIFTQPIHMPDATGSTGYTRVDGEIRFEGTTYRMVKQKTQGTLLYIVCVKDERTQIATDEINAIIGAVAGQPIKDSTPEAMKVINSLLKYCDVSMSPGDLSNSGWYRKILFAYGDDTYHYNNSSSLFHPPSLT